MKRLISLACALALLLMVHVFGQGTIMPAPFMTVLDNNGIIVSGAKLCTYAAGSLTPQATYSDAALMTPNTNPVVSDSAGRVTVYLSQVSYKFILYTGGTLATCDGTPLWTRDNISAVPATSGNADVSLATAGENISAGQVVYLSDGSGGKNTGQWYRADAGNSYSSTTAEIGIATTAIASGATCGCVRLMGRVTGLTGLTVGSEYFVGSTGAMTATLPKFARHVGHADTTTSLVATGDPQGFLLTANGLPTLLAQDGNILIGRSSDHAMVLGALKAGNGISIVNTSGGVTVTSGVFAHTKTSTTNPTGTASASGVMMGLAGSITPMATGTVLFCGSGNLGGSTGIQAQMAFGTGTAPVNGAAPSGTLIGTAWRDTVIANNQDPWGGCQLVTGLTVNTPVWYDVELTAITAGTATTTSTAMSAVELP